MKGHTRIELKDVNTGSVEIQEDDNMVTNALNLYLAAGGMGNSDNGLGQGYLRNYPLWQSLLGGLLLFDSPLVESVDNVLPSPGIGMTGNGAYKIANAGEVTEMGSYNETESGEQEDGSIRMVWDFSTSQANGTIACACLTSRQAGYSAFGNASGSYRTDGEVNGSKFGDFFFQPNTIITSWLKDSSTRLAYRVLYADYTDNSLLVLDADSIAYQDATKEKHWNMTGKIKINRYRYGLSAVQIKESYEISAGQLIETYDITVPEAIRSYFTNYTSNRFRTAINGKDVYILFSNEDTVAAGGFFYILHVNAAMQPTAYKVVNTADRKIQTINNCFFVTRDRYLFLKATDSPCNLFKINMNDNTDITEIPMLNSNRGANVYMLNEMIYQNTGNGSITDTIRNKNLFLNGSFSFDAWLAPVYGNPLMLLNREDDGYHQEFKLSIRRNCGYLATINNLKEPVVKTASKTMKVTYTITFD